MPTSEPQEEWHETAHKMYPVLKNLWPQEASNLLQFVKNTGLAPEKTDRKGLSFFYDRKQQY